MQDIRCSLFNFNDQQHDACFENFSNDYIFVAYFTDIYDRSAFNMLTG